MFGILALGISGGVYETLKPDGALVRGMIQLWQTNPISILAFCGMALLFKNRIECYQGAWAGDMIFIIVLMIGLYFAFTLLSAN